MKKNLGAFNISANWIEFAHRPGADSGHALAKELLTMPINKRGQIEIPRKRLDLIKEIKSVAQLYVGGRGGENDLMACQVVARCRKALESAYTFGANQQEAT